MWRETIRRMFVFIVVVALAAAFQARSVHGFSVDAQATAMPADMPMHGKCNGCAGTEKAMTPSGCSGYCTTMAALPFLVIAYNPIAAGTIESNIGPAATGHITPPDPYPPRPTRIS